MTLFLKNRAKLIFMILASLLICLGVFLTNSYSYADDAGFTTDEYNVQVVVKDDHTIRVKDTISVDFYENKHGIYRYIPYQADRYYISDIFVDKDPYSVSTENGNKVIKIGSSDKTIYGKKTYTILYTLTCYEDTYKDKDFFALDFVPTGWMTSINSANVSLTMPKDLDWSKMKLFVGYYGESENNEDKVDYSYNTETNTAKVAASNLPQGVGITMETTLPQGYWEGAKTTEWAKIPLIIILILIPVIAFIMWIKYGRDPKIVKTVEFYAPDDMTPAEIGYIIDGVIDQKDITSMVMYYANKGYLSVKEYKKGKIEITKLKELGEEEKRFSETIFEGLFESGDTVKLDELPQSFGDSYKTAVDQLKGYYTKENKLFKTGSKVCRIIGYVLMAAPAVLAILASSFIGLRFGYALLAIPVAVLMYIGMTMIIVSFDKKDSMKSSHKKIVSIVGIVLFSLSLAITAASIWLCIESMVVVVEMVLSITFTYLFTLLMKARTEKSAMWQGKILGFKNFIKAAELEKLKTLVDDDPEYFFNVMPYAYVMGLSDKWANKFEKIPTSAPEWYSSYDGSLIFNVILFNNMMRAYNHNMAASIGPIISADTGGGGTGGGFGGGGFSGGGFGGGGGGSW